MSILKTVLTCGIASVWLINGLFCKILNLVPRHELIVARILGESHAVLITKTIGVLEVLMAVWVLSRIKPRWCAIFQMIVVAVMNFIEFVRAPDLLFFGHLNAAVAAVFIGVVFLNEFIVKPSPKN